MRIHRLQCQPLPAQLAIVGVLVVMAGACLESCTPATMAAAPAVVRTVADLAAALCTDGEDPLSCIRKCEAELEGCECGVLTAPPLDPRCAPCEGDDQ